MDIILYMNIYTSRDLCTCYNSKFGILCGKISVASPLLLSDLKKRRNGRNGRNRIGNAMRRLLIDHMDIFILDMMMLGTKV